LLTFDEVFASDIGYRHEQVETVKGFLVVTTHLTILCESEQLRDRAVLVNAPGLKNEWMKQIPAYGGSPVAFAGDATVSGSLSKSGLNPLPYIFHIVHRIDFVNSHGMEVVYEGPSSSS
jgi:hypothetical protein